MLSWQDHQAMPVCLSLSFVFLSASLLVCVCVCVSKDCNLPFFISVTFQPDKKLHFLLFGIFLCFLVLKKYWSSLQHNIPRSFCLVLVFWNMFLLLSHFRTFSLFYLWRYRVYRENFFLNIELNWIELNLFSRTKSCFVEREWVKW